MIFPLLQGFFKNPSPVETGVSPVKTGVSPVKTGVSPVKTGVFLKFRLAGAGGTASFYMV